MTRRWFLSLLPASLAARWFPETLKRGDIVTFAAVYIENPAPLRNVELDGVVYPVERRDTPAGPQWFVKGLEA